jgi:Ala-tRNA(Pro) deacylase
MLLHQGRPADCSGRLSKEIRVYDLLDQLKIPYQRVDHEAAMTMEACVAVDQALEAAMCKNLLLCNRQCTDFYLLMLPGDKPFKTSVLSKQIGTSRLSFASGGYMEEFLDITPGSLSVMGLMNDKDHRVKLLIDEDILHAEYIGVHPCVNTASLRLRVRDLVQTVIPAMDHTMTTVNLPQGETA